MAHDAKHKKSRKGGAAKMILIVLLILVLAAGGCLLAIRKEINGSASAGEPVSVSIQQGSGVAAIAQKLKTAGVIKYPHVFRWYAGKQGAAGKLQYGEFDLAPGSSYDDIIEALSAYAKADSVRLTFPEGTTAIAIAKKMEDAGLCSAEDFLKEANTGDFSQYRFWQYVPDDKDAPDRFLKCEGVVGQLDVASGDGEDAPREGAGPRGAGDEVLALGHQQLQFVVASLHLLGRIGREVAAQGLAARGVVEVHARIVLQVGLGDDDFRRSGVCQDGQEGQAVVGDLRDGLGGVGVFEAVEVVAGQPRFLLAVAGVGDQRREVLRETDVHQLVRNGDFVLHRGAEPVGRAVVIGPEVDAVIPFERKRQRVVSVLDGAALVKGRFDDFVDAFCRRLAHRGFAAEHAPVGERERKGRGGDQLFAVARNGVGDGVGADIHAYGDFPVGGFQIVGFGCGNSGPGTE